MKKVFFGGVLIVGSFMFGPSAFALDYRMSQITWTFDKITELTSTNEVQNLGGIYFQGDSGSEIVSLGDTVEGHFSDGSSWNTVKAIMLGGHVFNATYLDGERRWAGIYNLNATNILAFNTTVSGTCYVAIRSIYSTNDESKYSLYCQYKGLHSGWTHNSFEMPASDEIKEMKLYCEAAGSFWICSNQDAYIYAVRFVPNDTMTLEKTRIAPKVLKQLSNGNWFADFGKDAFGQIELTLESESDDESIMIHLGECEKDGEINRDPGGSRRYRTITLPLKKGKHTYLPKIPADTRNTLDRAIHMPMEIGEVMPFRYCEIEGYKKGIESENVIQLAVHHTFNDDASYFHCDNEALNQVWELCKYTMKATSFSGYYIDGDRERIPYEADMLINQLGYYANDCEFSIGRRTIDRLLRIPNWCTEWILQTILLAYYDYLFYGDETTIAKYVDELDSHMLMQFVDKKTGLVSTRTIEQTENLLKSINRSEVIEDIVDWPHSGVSSYSSPRGGEDDNFDFTDYNSVVNAYHYEAVKRMAQLYEALNQSEKQAKLENYCIQFKELYNRSFLDKEKGIYRDGLESNHSSLHANIFPLCFGLVPDEYREEVADFIVSRGLACSVYGAQFLLDALYEARRAEEALALMTSTSERSWMNMIEKGSTMTMEAWDDSFKPNQDWNHAWGGAPANIIPFRMMGIRPIMIGFQRAEIRPQIANLKEVLCRVPTQYGAITIQINKTDNTYSIETDIPYGIDCVVYVPMPDAQHFCFYVDNIQVDDFIIEDGFIKLNNSISGKHSIMLKKEPETSIKNIEMKECGRSEILYDLRGRRISQPSQTGIYLKKGKKVIM